MSFLSFGAFVCGLVAASIKDGKIPLPLRQALAPETEAQTNHSLASETGAQGGRRTVTTLSVTCCLFFDLLRHTNLSLVSTRICVRQTIMHLANLLLFAGAVAALAFPPPHGGDKDDMCCCCDSSRLITVCNPGIPKKDCICTLVMCPVDAPTITETRPAPTPGPPPPPPGPAPPAHEKKNEDAPPPPPGKEWCCCCDGLNNVCSAKTVGQGCICTLIACPADAKTIYPGSRDRPGRPERPVRPDRPVRPTV